MPGIDILMHLGAAPWVDADAQKLQHAQQRARFDLVGIASQRALTGDIAGGNAEVNDALNAVPQLRGWVVVNPLYPERSAQDLRRYVNGPQWLGALLHPRMCGESLASGATRDLLNAYRRYTKPLLVDIADEAAVRDLEPLAKEFNSLKFIALGAGYDDWQACLSAAKRNPNIFLEPFSGGTHHGKLEVILELLGSHRVLFASAYPHQNPGSALGLLMDSKISDADKQGILSSSARRLFGPALTQG